MKKDDMVKISIIVPIYNVEKYLSAFFKSVESQNFKDYELILINDGSTDNSYSYCLDYKNKHQNVILINKKNSGVSSARNIGLERARGKYIYFCDPDDILNSNLLEENYEIAEKYKANVVIFGYDSYDMHRNMININVPKKEFLESNHQFQKKFPQLCENGFINYVWNKFYLKDSLSNLKFENVDIGEDLRFNLNYSKKLSKVYCNPKSYYHYLIDRPNSAMHASWRKNINYQIEEDKMIVDIINNVWQKKEDLNFISFKNWLGYRTAQYILSSSLSIVEKKKLIDKVFSLKDINILNYTPNSIKEEYNLKVIKYRKYTCLLIIDRLVRSLKNKVK